MDTTPIVSLRNWLTRKGRPVLAKDILHRIAMLTARKEFDEDKPNKFIDVQSTYEYARDTPTRKIFPVSSGDLWNDIDRRVILDNTERKLCLLEKLQAGEQIPVYEHFVQNVKDPVQRENVIAMLKQHIAARNYLGKMFLLCMRKNIARYALRTDDIEFVELGKQYELMRDVDAERLMKVSIRFGNTDAVRYLTRHDCYSPRKCMSYLDYALARAIEFYQLEIIRFLVEEMGCKISTRLGSNDGIDGVLHDPDKYTTRTKNIPIAKFMVTHMNINDNDGAPLSSIISSGDIDFIKYVFEESGAEPNVFARRVKSGLNQACLRGHIDAVRYILDKGVDISDPVDSDNCLSSAALRGNTEIIRFLVSRGATVNGAEGRALRFATCEAMKVLFELGADVHFNDDIALRGACFVGEFDAVRFLLERPDGGEKANIHALNDEPLGIASWRGYTDIVRYLVLRPDGESSEKADIHAMDDRALRDACSMHRYDAARFLLENGANVNVLADAEGLDERLVNLIAEFT